MEGNRGVVKDVSQELEELSLNKSLLSTNKWDGDSSIDGGQGSRKKKKISDFDDILNIVGSGARFQKLLLYGVMCPFLLFAPFLTLNNIFLLDIPDHWCSIPGRQGNEPDLESWKNESLPMETGPDGIPRFSQCLMYDPTDLGRNATISCPNGWTFDQTDYESTISSDYNWVCEKVGYPTEVFTVGTLGNALGTVLFGILADKIGRKPVYFMTCFVAIFFRTLSYFVAGHYWAFLTLQGVAGTAFPTIFSMPALLVAEVCGGEFRAWTYAVTWMIWVVGNSFLPLVAWVSRKWFTFGMISTLPAALLFLYYPFIDESPRWLLTVGRNKEALRIIKKIAKTNRVEINEQEINEMVESIAKTQREEDMKRNIGFWTLFQKYRLAKNTIMLVIAWSMNGLLYYGIFLNTTNMAGNRFLNYFLLSIIELPSGYLAGILVEKTGRRWTQAAFFLMCVISCGICALAVLTGADIWVIIGALGIKFGITITSMVVYLQGAEIFPTQLRSTGSALALTMSSVVGVTGPYIIFTGKFDAALPYVILGLVSGVGLVSSACLPETFRQHLPETVDAANKFGKGVKFWSYLPPPPEDGTDDGALDGENGATAHKPVSRSDS